MTYILSEGKEGEKRMPQALLVTYFLSQVKEREKRLPEALPGDLLPITRERRGKEAARDFAG